MIHRSDSSGTTSGFTSFLAETDPEFKSKVGEGKDVQWPTGTGAKGNAGVAGAIQQTVGAVGYVEQAYALTHKFTYASVKNKSGSYVEPSLASTSAAGEGVTIPANLGIKVINSPNADRLPHRLADVHRREQGPLQGRDPRRGSGGEGRRQFLDYGLGAGQSILSQADYAALPTSILAKSKEAAAGLQCNGAAISG